MTDQCKKIVHKADGTFHGQTYQCTRKAWKDGYCKQHHPETVKARRDAADQRRADIREARRRDHERPQLLHEALQTIADGRLNDPVGYAQMKLEEIYK